MTKFTTLQRIKNALRSYSYVLSTGAQDNSTAQFKPNFDDIQKLVKAYEDLAVVALAINVEDAAGHKDRLEESLNHLGLVLVNNHKLLNH